MDCIRIAALLSLTTGLAASATAANQLLTVGPSGTGAVYSSLQAAVDAASDGDVLLVKSGSYAATTVNGKALSIIVDDPTGLEYFKIVSLAITNVSAPRSVVVRGFRISEGSFLATPRLQISQCSGTIAIEDCQVENGNPATLQITDSSAVTMTHCVVVGLTGNSMAHRDGSIALRASNSQVALYDCTVEGGAGGNDHSPNQLYPEMPTDGGTGLAIESGSSVFVCGSIVSGGDGGDKVQNLFEFNQCGDGGSAITLGNGAILRRLNSPLIPGAEGTSSLPNGIPGQPGLPLLDLGGTVVVKSELARRFEASSPVREGEIQTLTVRGQPNEACWLLFSLSPSANYFSGLQGTLLPALPVTMLPLPQLDGDGLLELPVPIPSGVLPPGISAVPIYEQPMFIGASGPILLGSPSVMVLLDDSF